MASGIRMMPSHRQPVLPKTTARIGPFKGRLLDERDLEQGAEIRPGMRGQYVDLQERDQPTLQQFLGKLTDMGILPGETSLGGPSQAVTRFITAGTRIPQKAARILATQEFIDRMGLWGPSSKATAEIFASRYPRIAAHMDPYMADKISGSTTTRGITGAGKRDFATKRKTPVVFSKTANKSARDLMETMFHEGTHVAQELGLASKGGLQPTYEAAHKALLAQGKTPREAYWYNPPEVSARRVMNRKMTDLQHILEAGGNYKEGIRASRQVRDSPYRMGKHLNKLVTELPPGSPERIELGQLRLNRR